jgi:thymidylate synthase ThyX
LRLRLDTHAQWEIQQYGRVIAGIVKNWLPITWEAFDDYVLNGVQFSRQEQAVLLNVINTVEFSLQDPTQRDDIIHQCHDLGMSMRETNSFITKLEMLGGQFVDDIELDVASAKPPEFYEQMIDQHALKGTK